MTAEEPEAGAACSWSWRLTVEEELFPLTGRGVTPESGLREAGL